MNLTGYIERMWWRKTPPPPLIRWTSPIYGWLNAQNLRRRADRCHTPALPLISVGNITVGGSGKTPFVIWLAKALQKKGFHPVVLCRGDGGSATGPKIVSDDDPTDLIGDEARLLYESCDCTVIAARDRVAASRMAEDHGDVIILDDGFQYRQLARACDIVLVPADGTGNGALLLAGPLREPVSSLARADIIVRTGEGAAAPLTGQHEWRWRIQPGPLVQVAGSKSSPPKTAIAACAIARPERFFSSLRNKGVTLEAEFAFRDHHRFTTDDIARLIRPGLAVVITGKDAVKLRPLWPASVPLWRLEQRAFAPQGLLEAIVKPILPA